MTERQVATFLGVSVSTVRRLRKAGEIHSLPIRKRAVRYRPEELERWLQERSCAPGEVDAEARAEKMFGDALREVAS